jgi:hypothetical protein
MTSDPGWNRLVEALSILHRNRGATVEELRVTLEMAQLAVEECWDKRPGRHHPALNPAATIAVILHPGFACTTSQVRIRSRRGCGGLRNARKGRALGLHSGLSAPSQPPALAWQPRGDL